MQVSANDINTAEQMESALLVMILDKRISEWLRQNDPKALEQATKAVEAYEPGVLARVRGELNTIQDLVSKTRTRQFMNERSKSCPVLDSWQHENAICTAVNQERPWSCRATGKTYN